MKGKALKDGLRVAYARVSTVDQDLALQTDALEQAGYDRLFTDKMTGSTLQRPAFEDMNARLESGDVVIVWKLDRLGRSLKDLVNIVNNWRERGVEFVSLKENIDTTTPQGRLFFHMVCAMAEYEREMIKERTQAGIEAARARGRTGGRPRALTLAQVEQAKAMLAAGMSRVKIAKALGVARPTLISYLKEA